MNHPIKTNTASLLLSVFVCMAISVHAQTSKVFPLALSDNQRYLVDPQQKPFLIKEFSAWGLIQALSEKDEASFSSGQIDNQCYSFKNWKPLMNTQGMREVAYCLRLFDVLPWHKLVPDTSNDIILTDRLSQFGSRDFICAARASDGSFYVMYLPKGQSFEINTKKISGKPMRMHWYNPRTGVALRIGVADKERFGVAPPSEEDWVLVFDNDPTFKMPNKL